MNAAKQNAVKNVTEPPKSNPSRNKIRKRKKINPFLQQTKMQASLHNNAPANQHTPQYEVDSVARDFTGQELIN